MTRFSRPPFCCLLFLFLFNAHQYLAAQQSTVVIKNGDLQNGDYLWSSEHIYILDGLIYLEAGGKLTIEPGTTIMGRKLPSNGDPTSALIITRGAAIDAVGSPLKPILFTAEGDDLEITTDLTQNDRGLWGGLVILGNGKVATPSSPWFLEELPFSINNQFGGASTTDNSGRLRYVSIRHAGANGFAGLTLAGVGEASTLNHLEVFASGGDGIRLWGSDAAIKYVSVSFCSGDQFEWDYGWQGKGIYWLSLQDGPSGYGLHAKGGDGEQTELSQPMVYNITLIGPGVNADAGPEVAVFFEQGSGGTLANSIITEFPGKAIEVEDLPGDETDAYQGLASGRLNLLYNLWVNFGGGVSFATGASGIIKTSSEGDDTPGILLAQQLKEKGNHILGGIFVNISRQPDNALNLEKDCLFLPPAANYPVDDFFSSDGYSSFNFLKMQGALVSSALSFNYASDWWIGKWTTLEQFGYISAPCSISFHPILSEFEYKDTIEINCKDWDLLIEDLEKSEDGDLSFRCPYGCPGIGDLVVGKVRRRRSRRRANIDKDGSGNIPYCFVEEWSWKQYIYDNETLEVLDTIFINKYFGVYDNTPPELSLGPPTESGEAFSLIAKDCDSIFNVSYTKDALLIGGGPPYLHEWTAVDFCGNESTLNILEYPGTATMWYQDQDGDGYGDPRAAVEWQLQPPGFVSNNQDCNDQNPDIHPGITENPYTEYDDNCDEVGGISHCDDAAFVPVNDQFYPFSFLLSSTSEVPYHCSDTASIRGEIWLQTSVPSSGNVLIEYQHLRSVAAPSAEVFIGDCDNLNFLSCIERQSDFGSVSTRLYDLLPGSVLFVRLYQVFDYSELEIKFSSFELPGNNNCFGATPLVPTNDYHFFYEGFPSLHATLGSFPDPPKSCLSQYADYEQDRIRDTWFSTTIPPSEKLRVLVNYRTAFAIYTGECDELSFLRCATEEMIIENLPAGTPIFIRVFTTGYSLNLGLFDLQEPYYPNNDCIHAETLEVFSTPTPQWKTHYFASESSLELPLMCGYPNNERDIWYKAIIPASGDLIVEVKNNKWAVIQAYIGNCEELTPIACDNSVPSKIELHNRTPGQIILIRLIGLKTYDPFQILSYDPSQQPDDCTNARDISVDGECQSFTYHPSYASLTPGLTESGCSFYGEVITSDIWFRTTVPPSGKIKISNSGAEVGIYRGDCTDENFIGCSSYNGTELTDLTPGAYIYFRVYHPDGSVARDLTFEICLENPSEGNSSNLLAYYSFCDCAAADNSRVSDGIDGTVFGSPDCVDGPRGKAFRFNQAPVETECGQAGGDYIQLPELGEIWDQGFAISCWVRFDGNGHFERILDLGNGPGETGGMPIWFGREGNSNNLALESWTSSDRASNIQTGRLVAIDAIEPGVWSFFAASISGDTMQIFKNGVLIAQKKGHPIANVARQNNYIGRSNYCGPDPDFSGAMDEIRIYNRALTEKKVNEIYQNTAIIATDGVSEICEGEVLTLHGRGSGFVSWKPWYNISNSNSTTAYVWPGKDTTYYFDFELADGCEEKDSISISVLPRDISHNHQSICAGEQYMGYTQSGYYQGFLINEVGCDSIQVLKLEVLDLPEANIEIQGSTALVEIAGGSDGYVVAWSNGAQGLSSGTLEPGIHSVVITDINGCTFQQDFEIQDSTVGALSPMPSLQSIRLFPIPSAGELNIDVGFSVRERGKIELIYPGGQIVRTKVFAGRSIRDKLHLEDLPKGIYFLRITVDSGTLTRRVLLE